MKCCTSDKYKYYDLVGWNMNTSKYDLLYAWDMADYDDDRNILEIVEAWINSFPEKVKPYINALMLINYNDFSFTNLIVREPETPKWIVEWV